MCVQTLEDIADTAQVLKLQNFLDESHSAYHVQNYIARELNQRGYTRLREHEAWELKPEGKYYLLRSGSTLVAFQLPRTSKPDGFMISASHSDRPGFKLKENFEISDSNYTRAAVEPYGGMLMASWLDRPLSVAGQVTVATSHGLENRLVDIDRDLLVMPNVAIHMNRQANDGYKWNPAVDTVPLAGSASAAGKLRALVEKEVGAPIQGHDLFLYVRQKACVWGVDDAYISAQGLDDLACVWGCLQGFLSADSQRCVPVLAVFDNEEVGSASVNGAASTVLTDTLRRIAEALDRSLPRLLAQSFLVSADNAHAVHPNHPEYADPANAPVMGGGVVIKYSASGSYCTSGMTSAVFRSLCARAGVPVQTYCNRADLRGGSTLGRISLGQVSVPTVDIGVPQLAMHSCYETAAVADIQYMQKAMAAVYSASVRSEEESVCLL